MEKIEFECLLEGVTTKACDQMIEVLQNNPRHPRGPRGLFYF